MMSDVNSHFNGKPMILGRTKPMIACYPGNGSGYTRHVDNPSKDGRVLTCIYYLNKDWDCEKNGGNLRVFKNDDYNDISPGFNRMIVFWSDSRNPHEVQPAFEQRYAITTWYFDEAERMVAVEENQINAGITGFQRASIVLYYTYDDLKTKMLKFGFPEVDKMAHEIAMIKVKRTEQEKKIIQTKIEKTSKLAVLGLSDDELESISVLIGTSKDPKHVLGEMGIASSIQDILIDTLKLKGFLK